MLTPIWSILKKKHGGWQWRKSMVLIDANAILRYILSDNPDMALEGDELLKTEVITVRFEVVAEVVYVLNKVYSMPRDEIATCIKIFLEQPTVNIYEADILAFALETYGSINLDFVDCLLYSFAKMKKLAVFTFDKKLKTLVNKLQ
jgi:predicted nucleic-acid-binding protein